MTFCINTTRLLTEPYLEILPFQFKLVDNTCFLHIIHASIDCGNWIPLKNDGFDVNTKRCFTIRLWHHNNNIHSWGWTIHFSIMSPSNNSLGFFSSLSLKLNAGPLNGYTISWTSGQWTVLADNLSTFRFLETYLAFSNNFTVISAPYRGGVACVSRWPKEPCRMESFTAGRTTKDTTYEHFQAERKTLPCHDILVMMGDLNAKIRKDNSSHPIAMKKECCGTMKRSVTSFTVCGRELAHRRNNLFLSCNLLVYMGLYKMVEIETRLIT